MIRLSTLYYFLNKSAIVFENMITVFMQAGAGGSAGAKDGRQEKSFMLNVLYEDKDVLVAVKPAGMESQQSRRFEPDMVSTIKNYLQLSTKLSTSSSGAGEPYVGVIHRLDKPVRGVMVYAKTKRAASSLSSQVQNGKMKKTYRAVVCGKPVDIVGKYVDYLLRDGKKGCSRIVDKTVPGSQRAELSYQVLKVLETPQNAFCPAAALVEIDRVTGRFHQIRVQFAAHGLPLWGDRKYNPLFSQGAGMGRPGTMLALCAVRLSFFHPETGKKMEFFTEPEGDAFEQFREQD